MLFYGKVKMKSWIGLLLIAVAFGTTKADNSYEYYDFSDELPQKSKEIDKSDLILPESSYLREEDDNISKEIDLKNDFSPNDSEASDIGLLNGKADNINVFDSDGGLSLDEDDNSPDSDQKVFEDIENYRQLLSADGDNLDNYQFEDNRSDIKELADSSSQENDGIHKGDIKVENNGIFYGNDYFEAEDQQDKLFLKQFENILSKKEDDTMSKEVLEDNQDDKDDDDASIELYDNVNLENSEIYDNELEVSNNVESKEDVDTMSKEASNNNYQKESQNREIIDNDDDTMSKEKVSSDDNEEEVANNVESKEDVDTMSKEVNDKNYDTMSKEKVSSDDNEQEVSNNVESKEDVDTISKEVSDENDQKENQNREIIDNDDDTMSKENVSSNDNEEEASNNVESKEDIDTMSKDVSLGETNSNESDFDTMSKEVIANDQNERQKSEVVNEDDDALSNKNEPVESMDPVLKDYNEPKKVNESDSYDDYDNDDLKQLFEAWNRLSKDSDESDDIVEYNEYEEKQFKPIKNYEDVDDESSEEEDNSEIGNIYSNLGDISIEKDDKSKEDVNRNFNLQADDIMAKVDTLITSKEYDVQMEDFVAKHKEDIDSDFKNIHTTPIYKTLTVDQAVLIKSPDHYETNNVYDWILDGDGAGVELNITSLNLRGDAGQYLLIIPGGQQATDDGLIFTWRLRQQRMYRFLGVDRVFIRFVAASDSIDSSEYGFSLTVKHIFPTRYPEFEEEEEEEPGFVLPTPRASMWVFVRGVNVTEFADIREDFRVLVADMATFYINRNNIDMGLYSPQKTTQIMNATFCNIKWPDARNCTAIRFAVPLVYEDSEDDEEKVTPRLNATDLVTMWERYVNENRFAARLALMGIEVFPVPNDSLVLAIWILVTLSVIAVIGIIAYIVWHYNCIDNYTRMSVYDDNSTTYNEKQFDDLVPTPHQTFPPLFPDEAFDDKFGNKFGDKFNVKFDDSSRVDMGGYANPSYIRNDLLDSNDDMDAMDRRSRFTIQFEKPNAPNASNA